MNAPSRRRLAAGLALAMAAGIAAFWSLFFAGAWSTPADPELGRVWLAFESSFPLPDGVLAAVLALAGAGLWRGRPHGPPLALAGGGALVFLGLLDVSFNLRQGIYRLPPAEAVSNALVNAACIGVGLALAALAWPRPGEPLPPR